LILIQSVQFDIKLKLKIIKYVKNVLRKSLIVLRIHRNNDMYLEQEFREIRNFILNNCKR